MKQLRFVLAFAAISTLALTVAPRQAAACGEGGEDLGPIIGAVVVVTGVNVGLTTYDLTKSISGNRPSDGAMIFQAIWTAPQAAILTYAMIDSGEAPAWVVGWTAWTGAMSAFAVYHLARDDEDPRPMPLPGGRFGSAEFVVSPTAVQSQAGVTPGLGVVGRF